RESGEPRRRTGVARVRHGAIALGHAQPERQLLVVRERDRYDLEARCGEHLLGTVLVQIERVLELTREGELSAERTQPVRAAGREPELGLRLATAGAECGAERPRH